MYIRFMDDEWQHVCEATQEEWDRLIAHADSHPIDGSTIDPALRDEMLDRPNVTTPTSTEGTTILMV